MSPGGRRPGDSGTREAILAAAARSFAAQGYTPTSVRAIAREAGVDPALVVHFFGSKDALFEASLALPFDPPELVAGLLTDGPDGLGERVVRTFLGVWDATPGQGPLLALLRSAVSYEEAAQRARDLLLRAVLLPVARGAGGDRPELRAALLASQVVGLAVTRYVLRMEPVASASAAELVPLYAPTLQRTLTGELAPGLDLSAR